MATFTQVAKGTRTRRPVPLPLGDAPLVRPVVAPDGTITFPASPDAIEVAVRVLSSLELGDVLERARRDAVARGVADPRDGNPIYDLAEMEHTVALATVDTDSPESAPRPFFDGGVEQLRASHEMGRDRIAYLFEQQQLLQDECSPTVKSMGPDEMMGAMLALAGEGGSRFFTSLGPALRVSCALTLAKLWWTSLQRNSPPTSPSDLPGTLSSKSERPEP